MLNTWSDNIQVKIVPDFVYPAKVGSHFDSVMPFEEMFPKQYLEEKMKRLLLTYAIAAACIGLSPAVMADLSSTETGSGGTYVKDRSEDSDFDWWYSLLDDVFGWDNDHHGSRYYYRHDSLGFDSGNGGDAWSFDPGDGGWDFGSGADTWGLDSGNGGWGSDYPDAGPPIHTPAPGAFVLGSIGLAFAGWLGRRKKYMG